ncbi:unnamed protein product [Moneuplotes crassus]|uniref:Uncharacterized protein n=1 Tax=Euplotes crassus TaxID=5936 RepID=A0AAD1X9I0_EUPCR|nr:unnamed protein product [Moneuplotes crassus]
MSEIDQFDENLSEELLDENASASSVNVSPSLDRNMSSSPFQKKAVTSRRDVFPLSQFGRFKSSKQPRDDRPGTMKMLNYVKEEFRSKQFTTKTPVVSRLQSDIRELLKKAVQQKSQSKPIPKANEVPSPTTAYKGPPPLKLVKDFTIHEVQTPECFSGAS